MPCIALLSILLAADDAPATQWQVACTVDALDDSRTCMLASGVEARFAVFFTKTLGPLILAGDHDFPGKEATVRVDQNKAISFIPAGTAGASAKDIPKQAALVEQLRTGRVVLYEYQHWPDGAHRKSFSLDGFKEAFAELLRQRGLTGDTSWKQGVSQPKAVKQPAVEEPLPPGPPPQVAPEPERRRKPL